MDDVRERTAHWLDSTARHTAHVYSVAAGEPSAVGVEEVSTSWQRSANRFHLDPADMHAPSILTPREIDDHREPLAPLLHSAREEIESLYRLVQDAGYVVLFCDPHGVAVEHRGQDRAASEFRYWGTWLGGVWPEEAEGTNGIGTAIVEQRPVTVHRSQHFRSRNKDLSCSGAPVFGVDGALLAVLDVSAVNPLLSESAHALTGILTETAARAIEERHFRESFRRAWIVAVALQDEAARGMLLALDDHQRILGADRAARASLLLDDAKIAAGVSLWSLFERNLALFRHRDAVDLPARLTIAGGNETLPALLTAPELSSRGQRNGAIGFLHTRPRLGQLATLWSIEPPPQVRGGLSAAAMCRVRDHVETHLSEAIDLAALAAIAGVSVFHFARQFKQSAGMTPHAYVLRRRVERARELLARSDRPLSEIALMTGFSDQSHFARQFRQHVGMTPSQFRWTAR